MNLLPVNPTHETIETAHVSRTDGTGGFIPVPMRHYPETAKAGELRRMRLARGLTLRDASEGLNMKPSELSGLEQGRFTLSEPDWDELFLRLDAVSSAGREGGK